MRIHEVSKCTGLTKKAIHFYVNEGLVHPRKLENNYYEFSDHDVALLNQIIAFRKAGISIQTIKEIYDYPAATNFFLHRSFNQLKQELADKMTQLENLEMILETIPPNGTPQDVEKIPLDTLKSHSDSYWIDSKHPSFDERMVAILVLAPFMDIQVDEYKQYLWDKIFNDLKMQFKDNLSSFSKLIYSLDGQKIREASMFQFNLLKQVAACNDTSPYVDYLMNCVRQLNTERELQQKWMYLYQPVIQPVLSFFKRTSEKKRISQYNPMFDLCAAKLEIIIKHCAEQIKGTDLEQQLIHNLEGKISIEDTLYSDLYFIFTFHKSIYTQCSLSEIKCCFSDSHAAS